MPGCLYTGQRGGDVVNMTMADIKDGAIGVVQKKTAEDEDDVLWIAIHPDLDAALGAYPRNGLYLIGDKYGRPIKRPALSLIMAKAAKAAGLLGRCVPHGLRKSSLPRLAEHGSTTKEIQAVSGYRSLQEAERYTERASRKRLAKAAIAKLPNAGGTKN
jgi:integrase